LQGGKRCYVIGMIQNVPTQFAALRTLLPALAVLLASCQTIQDGGSAAPESVAAYMARTTPGTSPSDWRSAFADLNGDGAFEALVYLSDEGFCGTGGCNLLVLTPVEGRYRPVADMSVTRLPVRKLETMTNGWSDLGVTVAGGGIDMPGEAWMRFDGAAYPGNPTVEPMTDPGTPGQVLLAAP